MDTHCKFEYSPLVELVGNLKEYEINFDGLYPDYPKCEDPECEDPECEDPECEDPECDGLDTEDPDSEDPECDESKCVDETDTISDDEEIDNKSLNLGLSSLFTNACVMINLLLTVSIVAKLYS